MKDFTFDSLPTLNSNPAKNTFLAACSSTSADMPRACESFMKITRQFQNNFPQPAAAFGVFSRELPRITRELFENYPCHVQRDEFTTKFTDNLREFTFREATRPSRRHPFFLRKLSQITRKLAFSLPHRRLSSVDASITLPQWSLHPLRFLNGLCTPFSSPVIGGQKRYRGTETAQARFMFREATKPFGTNRAAKTERNVNNYHNAPLALFRNNNTPWRIPHGRSETARDIRMISGRGAAALGLLCTFLSERIPWTCCRKCFAARGRTPVLIGYGRGFYLQACLQGKDRGEDYRQQNRVIVE